ncbi:MAG: uncharacterized protein KVP18_004971 [Porospora cf. gigantea A]|uniref:uncharacterized protein n=1 Tax=Porospora cf. gigantea A TaxID=2853593 RepID=UPI003559A171|nr:MAG: hypothetical protein KVP18_004971 [Porospora cf. gigantea A]
MSLAYEHVPLDKMQVGIVDGQAFLFYQCPCGDFFELSVDELRAGARVAVCPSCSLEVVVIQVDADQMRKLENSLT